MTLFGESYSAAELQSWPDNAVSMTGAKVLRVHLNGRALEPSLGAYSEPAFVELDRLLAAASTSDLRVVIALRDYLWAPWPPQADDPYWYLGGGTPGNPNKSAVLNDAQAKAAYRSFAGYVIGRRNTVDGRIYREDPVIFGWELINEPEVVPGRLGPWIAEMGAHVRALDASHLVGIAVGAVELKWWNPGSANWTEHSEPVLDFVDLHYYAPPALYAEPVDAQNVVRLRDRLRSARALGKPFFVGEFGAANTVTRSTLLGLYRTIVQVTFEEGGAGALAYSWGPPGPNGWGGPGSFDFYTNDSDLAGVLRGFAP